jgi:rfaE bifunctional protein nucleotidyltransferase chain/domain
VAKNAESAPTRPHPGPLPEGEGERQVKMQNTKVKVQNEADAARTADATRTADAARGEAIVAFDRPHPGPLPEGEGEYGDCAHCDPGYPLAGAEGEGEYARQPHPGAVPDGTSDGLTTLTTREEAWAARMHRGCILEGEEIAAAVELARTAREQGRSVAFTSGCFDLLHCGHLATLELAKSLGDVLIVAVNSDESARRLKGAGRPATGSMLRAGAIAALGYVDCVVVFDDDTPAELIRDIRPDVLVEGAEYRGTILPGSECAGRVEFAPMLAGVSTTEILNQIEWERRVRKEKAESRQTVDGRR